jgi:hypothetical protein
MERERGAREKSEGEEREGGARGRSLAKTAGEDPWARTIGEDSWDRTIGEDRRCARRGRRSRAKAFGRGSPIWSSRARIDGGVDLDDHIKGW